MFTVHFSFLIINTHALGSKLNGIKQTDSLFDRIKRYKNVLALLRENRTKTSV